MLQYDTRSCEVSGAAQQLRRQLVFQLNTSWHSGRCRIFVAGVCQITISILSAVCTMYHYIGSPRHGRLHDMVTTRYTTQYHFRSSYITFGTVFTIYQMLFGHNADTVCIDMA